MISFLASIFNIQTSGLWLTWFINFQLLCNDIFKSGFNIQYSGLNIQNSGLIFWSHSGQNRKTVRVLVKVAQVKLQKYHSGKIALIKCPHHDHWASSSFSWRKYRKTLRAEQMNVSLVTQLGTITGQVKIPQAILNIYSFQLLQVKKYYGLTTEMFSGLLEGTSGAGTAILRFTLSHFSPASKTHWSQNNNKIIPNPNNSTKDRESVKSQISDNIRICFK